MSHRDRHLHLVVKVTRTGARWSGKMPARRTREDTRDGAEGAGGTR